MSNDNLPGYIQAAVTEFINGVDDCKDERELWNLIEDIAVDHCPYEQYEVFDILECNHDILERHGDMPSLTWTPNRGNILEYIEDVVDIVREAIKDATIHYLYEANRKHQERKTLPVLYAEDAGADIQGINIYAKTADGLSYLVAHAEVAEYGDVLAYVPTGYGLVEESCDKPKMDGPSKGVRLELKHQGVVA